jgi:hypothetical protein
MDRSDVEYGVAGGSDVWMEQPRLPSAIIARTPSWIYPGGESSHSVAGIVNVTAPGSTSVMNIPVRWASGGGRASPL